MDDWLKTAKQLAIGRSVRVVCCGKDRSRVITHSDKGYSSYCFRQPCDTYFEPATELSLKERAEQKKLVAEYMAEQGDITLPPDFTTDIPDAHKVWFYKYGVPDRLIEHYGFGWSAKQHRVVLPVYDEHTGELGAVQCRSIDPKLKPKYLNKEGGTKSPMFWSKIHHTDVLVITEDILSAVRVGELYYSVCTLGTSINTVKASRIVSKDYNKVLIWYDGDDAGRNGAKKGRRELLLQGADCSVIETELDPKEYDNDEIEKILSDYT